MEETNFQSHEFTRRRWKAEGVEEVEREENTRNTLHSDDDMKSWIFISKNFSSYAFKYLWTVLFLTKTLKNLTIFCNICRDFTVHIRCFLLVLFYRTGYASHVTRAIKAEVLLNFSLVLIRLPFFDVKRREFLVIANFRLEMAVDSYLIFIQKPID